ncbi:MAG: hypothetical protein US60_C0003G0032 [Microgenomates group bacterium GW2011_GWC1_37_8]|uniref:Uncharacterized protein n=1 Tax=Candidatus Woesebacteria bacterium GW2011_GWB1_38_8 TaxID=1618570 RepID=A0A0G0P8X6_9BACT|nr:MAG: hypothetical protein US60_C0003G0032 [Microgenomates group bacterium GW2011_GWC1_37_8]KKQ85761.1 MAG: hypothetical protein UT08_C0004G0073 [Candidatus Woesebacteria bacterium GW2011_GWB1_38_8]
MANERIENDRCVVEVDRSIPHNGIERVFNINSSSFAIRLGSLSYDGFPEEDAPCEALILALDPDNKPGTSSTAKCKMCNRFITVTMLSEVLKNDIS